MPLTLLTGPANAGKAEAVMAQLRLHLDRGEEPLLVVPTRADASHYLRELAGSGTAMGVRVERFEGLVGEAVRRAGVHERALGALARERLVASLCSEEGEPASPGLVRALCRALAELEQARVTPQRLRRVLDSWRAAGGGSIGAERLALLHARYAARLSELRRVDEDGLAARALDELRVRPYLWGATPVLLYGFDDLTPLQLDAIETLGRVVDAPLTVALAFERGRAAFAGRAAAFHALAPIAAEHRELAPRARHYAPASRGPLSHLERGLFETDAASASPGAALRMIEAPDEREELRAVAREVRALLQRGVPPEEIAVAMRSPAGRAELIEEVFRGEGIALALQRRRRFAETALGRALCGLLRTVPAEGRPPGRAADLLAWLRAPGLLVRPQLADRLEQELRHRGIEDAAGARAAWEEHNWPLEVIDRLAAAEGADRARAAVELLELAGAEMARLFALPRRGGAGLLAPHERDEARALAAARAALAELRELAGLDPSLAPADAPALAEVLAGVEFVAGDRPGPGAVAVSDPLALRARRVRALFLCCMQEGVFPAPPRSEPVLGQEERRALAEHGGIRLAPAVDPLAAERWLLYAAVSRPEELLCLSWHSADDDGTPRGRSLFVDDVLDLFDPEPARSEGAPAAGAPPAPVPAPDAPLRLRDARVLGEIARRPWSASALEAYLSCPARWFVERVLRPNDIDPDAEPLRRGRVSHDVLREVFEGLRDAGQGAGLTAASLPLALRLLGEAVERHGGQAAAAGDAGRSAAAALRLRSELERYLSEAAEQEWPLEPTRFEMGFGFGERGPDGEELPALDLGGGLRVRGRIDRVDVGEQGEAVVVDYKSSSARAGARWEAEGDLQAALYMLASEQLLGLRAAGGLYQPLSGRDIRPRGVLDEEAGLELGCVGNDVMEHEAVRALLRAAADRAREASAAAAGGEIPPRPRTCGYNGAGCSYPSLCRCEP